MRKITKVLTLACVLASLGQVTALAEWENTNNGWKYVDATGDYVKNDMRLINNSWYSFDEKGIMTIGFVRTENAKYITDATGAILTGQWVEYNGHTYYANQDGKLSTGWLFLNNKWYFFEDSGALNTKTKRSINNAVFYFHEDGSMVQSQFYDGKYVNSSGMVSRYLQPIQRDKKNVDQKADIPDDVMDNLEEQTSRIPSKIMADMVGTDEYRFVYYNEEDNFGKVKYEIASEEDEDDSYEEYEDWEPSCPEEDPAYGGKPEYEYQKKISEREYFEYTSMARLNVAKKEIQFTSGEGIDRCVGEYYFNKHCNGNGDTNGLFQDVKGEMYDYLNDAGYDVGVNDRDIFIEFFIMICEEDDLTEMQSDYPGAYAFAGIILN